MECAGAIRRVSDTDGDREEKERRPASLRPMPPPKTDWSATGKPLLFQSTSIPHLPDW